MNTEIFFILIIYSAISFILTYYVNLFLSKSEYTRQEFSDIIPQLGNMLKKISSNYSLFSLLGIILLSAYIAIIILYFFTNWVLNSAIIPALIFFLGPRLAIYFEETRVTILNNYADIIETVYSRYYRYVIAGFLAGFGTKLIDNWINLGAFSFYWFIINFVINTVFLILIIREDIFDN